MEVPGDTWKELYYHLGAAYRRVGRYDEARKMLNVALYYDPNYQAARAEREALDAPRRGLLPPDEWLPGSQFDPFAAFTRPP
jgi:hypothetical protein